MMQQTFEHNGVTYTVAPVTQYQQWSVIGYMQDWREAIAKAYKIDTDSGWLYLMLDKFFSWHMQISAEDKPKVSLIKPDMKLFGAFVDMLENDHELFNKISATVQAVDRQSKASADPLEENDDTTS